MTPNARTFHHSQSKLCKGIVVALLMLVIGSARIAQAATIPFTFEVTYDTFVNGVPGPTSLTVPGATSGSGIFAPFGSAIWSETGTVTFAMLPSGDRSRGAP
jgi:hypothetical protein